MRIQLTDLEVTIGVDVGTARQDSNRAHGVTENLKADLSDALQLNIWGAIAELAVARALNVYPDFDIIPRAGGWDLKKRVNGEWVTFDVKHTIYDKGKLLIDAKKREKDSDVYVLVTGKPPVLHIRGWIWAQDAMQPRNYNRFDNHGDGWHVTQGELTPWGQGRTKVE